MSRGGWDLEEIRRRADIVDIISPYVRLRKAGRRLVGLCPFHQERTPSFTVDPEKGFWHCFGCKAGGDLFRFVEMMEKVTFAEAVELLARRLGLPPKTPADGAQHRARERLLTLHNEAAQFFHSCLKAKPGAQALAYLRDRGVSPQATDDFLLGYAPDTWDALLNFLEKRGFSGKELARAGLVVVRQDGGFYDRFRNRLIFPICDATGRVIAFGGRALADDQQPKYLNSPETMLFQKGQTLWAFDRARRAIADSGRAIIVEGYLDAIACHEAGFAETVATMGTSLTREHVELLRRRTERLLLSFDSDSAGLAAALRGRDLFQEAGLEVWVVTMPEGMDPDNVIRLRGADSFRRLLEEAEPMLEWQLGRILTPVTHGDRQAKIRAIDAAVELVAQLPHGAQRNATVAWLAEKTRIIAETAEPNSAQRKLNLEMELREALKRSMDRAEQHAKGINPNPLLNLGSSGDLSTRRLGRSIHISLLAALLQRSDLAERFMPLVEREDFPDDMQKTVYTAIVHVLESGETVSPEAVLTLVEVSGRELVAQLTLMDVLEEQIEQSVATSVKRLVEARLRKRQNLLSQRLNEPISEQEREALRQELNKVTRQRSELAGWRIIGEN